MLTILSVNLCFPFNPLNIVVDYYKFQLETTWKVSKAATILALNIIELGAAYERGAHFNWGLHD